MRFATFVGIVLVSLATATPARAQLTTLSEGFENVAALTSGGGWFTQNNSSPVGTGGYFQGNATVMPAQSGPTDSYAGVNFESGAGTATLSNWLLTPQLDLSGPSSFTFFTRSVNTDFADRLQIRVSTAGASTNVGTAATDVGDFTNLVLDINPTLDAAGYPTEYTQYTIDLAAQANGRIAFRYFVENGGPDGVNSNYVGIDTVTFSPVPEPGTILLAGAGVFGLVQAFRRRRAA